MIVSTNEIGKCFEIAELTKLKEEMKNSYRGAAPFPHIVIDDFLPENFINEILNNFPKKEDATVNHKSNTQFLKRGYRPQHLKGNPCEHYLSLLNTSSMLTFLEELTGIKGLIPDPYFEGGGLHETEKGGRLQIHTDFTWNERLSLARRINMIIFLNKDWKDEYGGELELWSNDNKQKVKSILPIFNRCVIFNTTSTSFHGHPEPLTCLPSMSRKSIALYYYTVGEKSLFTSTTKWKKDTLWQKLLKKIR